MDRGGDGDAGVDTDRICGCRERPRATAGPRDTDRHTHKAVRDQCQRMGPGGTKDAGPDSAPQEVAGGPWENHFTSLDLCFLTCQMEGLEWAG